LFAIGSSVATAASVSSVQVPEGKAPSQVGDPAQTFPLQKSVPQSAETPHESPAAHAGHAGPPQSTSVSPPFAISSVHVGTDPLLVDDAVVKLLLVELEVTPVVLA
jgi:hypothetical protein